MASSTVALENKWVSTGVGKKIVSFVVFGSKREYTFGAIENAKLIDKIYPGWIGRFYIGDDVSKDIVDEINSFANIEVIIYSVKDHPGREAQV